MAEREGFEPSIPVTVYALSRGAPSATRPSLQKTFSYYKLLLTKSLLRGFWRAARLDSARPELHPSGEIVSRLSKSVPDGFVSHSAISPKNFFLLQA